MEEPPTKVTKFEMDSQFLESEVMEEGQEEWLSEGILTDDDYNPASQEAQPGSDSNFATSQDDDQTMPTISDESQVQSIDNSLLADSSQMKDSNIEETLNNFENSQSNTSQDIPSELSAFLTRKSDHPTEPAAESELDESKQKQEQEEDDGNDTDDLLRLLGDGDQKVKRRVKKATHGDSSDEDDGFIFEGKKVQNYDIAKKALMRATASKAVPEDDDITDCSSDEAPLSKIQEKPQPHNAARQTNIKISTDVKPGNLTITPPAPPTRNIVKKVINVTHAPVKVKKQTTPVKQYTNKRLVQDKSLSKPVKTVVKRTEVKAKPAAEEIINEKDFFEDDDVDLDEDFTQKSTKASKSSQRIMRPEEMDEEVPTDNDSCSDEESLYDELPSSDSDQDLDDWFTLDIRAERAGDYLPLLGDRALQLLLEEKRRVAARLETLKKSLSALTESGREQAEKLREATSTAAELDAMLRAN